MGKHFVKLVTFFWVAPHRQRKKFYSNSIVAGYKGRKSKYHKIAVVTLPSKILRDDKAERIYAVSII